MITKEQYGEWRNHPATQFYRQFLKDRAHALITEGMDSWLNSPDSFMTNYAERRARILQLFECEELSFEVIKAFYNYHPEGDNAGKDT